MIRHLSACLLSAAILMLSLSIPALALDPGEMFDNPAQEARARDIGRQLRCLKCRNQSIFDSNAGIAKDLRVVVRERMIEGDSDSEILAYVSERFGDYVLLKPRMAAHTYALWSTPLVLLGLGSFFLIMYLRGRPLAAGAQALSDEDRARAQHLLDGEGSQ